MEVALDRGVEEGSNKVAVFAGGLKLHCWLASNWSRSADEVEEVDGTIRYLPLDEAVDDSVYVVGEEKYGL